ncbi:MAG: zinc-dependent metalloprotease, partial [Chloroherpetonaceae bacterium]|nr:zinc-dependent metalloprotease [Chloroherpetonaceae bacterium]
MRSHFVICLVLVLCGASTSVAQLRNDSLPSSMPSRPKIRPYAEVIKGATTLRGIFDVHRIEDKVYYEIPQKELGKEFLIVAQVSKTQASYGYGGTELANRVVKWERKGNMVLLRNVYYGLRSTDGNVKQAVANSNIDAILMSFDILAFGKDSSVVIDVTPMFVSDMPEFSPRQQPVNFAPNYDATSLDPKRTFIESIKAFPTNIETRAVLTYRANPVTPNRAGSLPTPQPSRPRADNALGSITVEVHFSMVRLPEVPMKPREYDSRIGFFTQDFVDYNNSNSGIERKRYISRFRLEKKDTTAELSEPVKPIIFYIAPEVPAKWRPYIKRGVEAWQKAFEKAGFKNAILAKDAPDDNPNWDPEDARYCSIRWLPSEIQNAYGPSIRDPRSGEIIDADIKFFHNVQALVQKWYFLQAGAVDERANQMPLPDDLSGELIEYVAAHEVGHCLGFPHNFKASSSYTVKQLRDAQFTAKYGTEASIMDYGRFNYVAQPEDKPRPRLIPTIGPYDEFAVEWGYKPFYGLTPEQEKEKLNEIAMRQIANPMLRFGRQGDPYDPTAQSEDIGSDPLEATALGLKNLARVSKKMLTAFTRPNEDYTRLKDIAEEFFTQRSFEVGHVASLIGGMVETNYFYGQGEKNFEPVPREKQKAAMKFLQENVFQLPKDLLPREVIDRIGAVGYADLILGHQARVLAQLMNTARTKAMVDYEIAGNATYTLTEMVSDLSDGIFSELSTGRVSAMRRNLQREFVKQLIEKTQPTRLPTPGATPRVSNPELKAVAVGTLEKLLKR